MAAKRRTRYLIVNADDFGQSPGVNRGIVEAHDRGIVTSASLMVRWPAAAQAAVYSRKHPELGLGIHFDFGEWACRRGSWLRSAGWSAGTQPMSTHTNMPTAAGASGPSLPRSRAGSEFLCVVARPA